MNRIDKLLSKVSSREKRWVKSAFLKIKTGDTTGLDVKKLKGYEDIFRIRKGRLRIIYFVDKNKSIFVLKVERRSETTYKF